MANVTKPTSNFIGNHRNKHQKDDVKDEVSVSKTTTATTTASTSPSTVCTWYGTQPENKKRRLQKKQHHEEKWSFGKLSTTTTTTKRQGFDELDANIIELVYSFLSIKDLFRVAYCSKLLMSVITHEHVARAAVLDGGQVATNMLALSNLIKRGAIIVPSPLRMLRLMNGKYCERMKNCLGGKKPNRVLSVNEPFGLFLCDACLYGENSAMVCIETDKKNELERDLNGNNHMMLFSGRTCPEGYFHGLAAPFVDSSGERASSFVTWQEYNDMKLKVLSRQQQQQQTLKGQHLLQQYSSEQEQMQQMIYQHRKRIELSNPWSIQAKCIIETCDKAVLDYPQWTKERFEIRKARTKQTIHRVVNEFIPSLIKYVKTPELRHIISRYTVLDSFDYSSDDTINHVPCVWFKCNILNDIFEPLILNPAKKVSKRKLKQIASDFEDQVHDLATKGLFDFSCLSSNETLHPLENAVREYLIKKYPNPEQILLHEYLDSDFLGWLDRGEGMKTILLIFDHFESLTMNDCSTNIDTISPDGGSHKQTCPKNIMMPYQLFGEAFATKIVQEVHTALTTLEQRQVLSYNEDALLALARSTWRFSFGREAQRLAREANNGLSSCRFQRCRQWYLQILPIAVEYVQDVYKHSYFLIDTPNNRQGMSDYVTGFAFWSYQDTPGLLLRRKFDELRRRLCRQWERYCYISVVPKDKKDIQNFFNIYNNGSHDDEYCNNNYSNVRSSGAGYKLVEVNMIPLCDVAEIDDCHTDESDNDFDDFYDTLESDDEFDAMYPDIDEDTIVDDDDDDDGGVDSGDDFDSSSE